MVRGVIVKKDLVEGLHHLDVLESQLAVPHWPVLSEEADDGDHVGEEAGIDGAVVQEELKHRRLVLEARSELRLRPVLRLLFAFELAQYAG